MSPSPTSLHPRNLEYSPISSSANTQKETNSLQNPNFCGYLKHSQFFYLHLHQLIFTKTKTDTTLHTQIHYYYTYHSAKVRTNPDKNAFRKSKSLSSITYIALFIIAFSPFFLKIHTITRMRHPFSTLYCSCSQCILFTNCGINSSKISSRSICKCLILDIVKSLSDCARYFQFELVYGDTPLNS